MPNTDMETLLAPILKEFAQRIAKVIEGAALARVRAVVDSAFDANAAALSPVAPAPTLPARPAKRMRPAQKTATPPANPKLAEARRTQGVYMGLLRNFKGAERAQVKAAAAKDGIAAGVELAKRHLARRS